MTGRTGQGRALARHPVRVLMRRTEQQGGRWRIPRWEVLAVLPDADPPDRRERRLVHREQGQRDFEWAGLQVPLYRDAAESYWYNLVGREPSLFIVCRPGDDVEFEPFIVTANYDEAGAHMEADDRVFSAPLPAALTTELETFVMNHYKPSEPKKRRRRNWSTEADDAQRRD